MKKTSLLFLFFLIVIYSSAQVARSTDEYQHIRNGSSNSSALISNGNIESLSVYPNPVIDIVKISFKSNYSCKATISLFNNIGKQVYSMESITEHGSNIFSIDVRSKAIEPGIYFIKIIAEKEILTRKLIIK